MEHERRQLRTPVALYANEISAYTREISFVTSMSLNGLMGSALSRPHARSGKRALMEIDIPDGESPAQMRAMVELVHENHGPLFRQTAFRFVNMPDKDRTRITTWLKRKQMELEQLGS